jgi:hypothetical protein
LAAFFIRPEPLHFSHGAGKILRPGAGCFTAGKPVPLQAGHFSSTLSNLICFFIARPASMSTFDTPDRGG